MKKIICILFGHTDISLKGKFVITYSEKWEEGFPTEDRFICKRCGEARIYNTMTPFR